MESGEKCSTKPEEIMKDKQKANRRKYTPEEQQGNKSVCKKEQKTV